MFIPWPVRLFGKKSAVASPPVVSFETNLWPKMLAKCINMTGCFDEFSVLKWLPQLSVSLCTWSWTWQLKLDSWGLKRIAGEHFGNTSGYSPMVFEHHDFEALQCWNGSHSNWRMNNFRGREGERKWIATFCGWFVLSTLFISLYVSFFSSLEALQAQDGNWYSYHRTMQQKTWTSKQPDPVFFPHPAYGIGDFGNVAVSQN